MVSGKRFASYGVAMLLGACTLTLCCEAAEHRSPWPPDEKRAAIRGCRQALTDAAINDYKKRTNVSQLAPDLAKKVAEVAEMGLGICDCVVNELERSVPVSEWESGSKDLLLQFSTVANVSCGGYLPKNWKNYVPTDDARRANERVSLEKVIFLESEEILTANTTTEEVLGFIERARKAATDAFVSYKGNIRLAVGFNCNPGNCSSILAGSQSAPLQQCLDALGSRLAALTPPKTSGPVGFYALYQVHPQ